MDARRLRLYELLKPKLDEEPARELVLALPPSPDELLTKREFESGLTAGLSGLTAELAKLEYQVDVADDHHHGCVVRDREYGLGNRPRSAQVRAKFRR